MGQAGRTLVAGVCGVCALAMSAVAHGYSGDTHYYLCFAIALETCFDWDEAHLIASADLLVDKNRTTSAEKQPFQSRNKIDWHAFGGSEERFNQLWERALSEDDPELQLVKLGQFLHFVADWESHFGYGVRMAHGVDTFLGRDPDSLGANRMNNLRMIDQTIGHLMEICAARGRGRWQGDDPDVFRANLYKELSEETLLEEMFAYNTRKWKSFGVRGKKGKQILAKNELMIEQFVGQRSKGVPGRGVPADFTPGDPDRGLPPPVGIRFDRDGESIETYGVEIELRPEYDGDRVEKAREDALEEAMETRLVDDLEQRTGQQDDSDLDANLELDELDADLRDDGWRVSLRVRNLGDGDAKDGRLEVVVLDIGSEDLLGSASRPVPAVKGRDEIRMDVFVESEAPPTKAIMIGASLIVDDLSADNNDAWFAPWREGEEVGKKKKETRKPESDLPVEILGAPKMWIDETGEGAWFVVQALVSGGRSSRRIETLRASLVRDDAKVPASVNDGRPVVFMSMADLRRRAVPAEGLFWIRFDESLCSAVRESATPPHAVELTVSGAEIHTTAWEHPLTPQLVNGLARACSSAE